MNDVIPYLLISFCIFIFLFPLMRNKIVNYLRTRKYIQIEKEIAFLFANINPFTIALEGRRELGEPTEELIYGEIDPWAILDLLDIVQPKDNHTFYDLGSGCGKSALAVKLRYPTLRVRGIELVPALHNLSEQKLQEYCNSHALSKKDFDVIFICDNILNQNFMDADILFINATGISSSTWEQLFYKLMHLKQGAVIITTTKQLPMPAFQKRYEGMKLMSWGFNSTFIFEKII